VWKRAENGYVLEKFVFDNGIDAQVPGYIALPKTNSRVPAVVSIHGHGGCKEEILGSVPSAHAVVAPLTRKGYAVLVIDNYFSGERRGTGPDGMLKRWRSSSNAEELSLYKLNIWLGRSLWGMMLRDQQIALDYLTSRPEIDSARIGVHGMSMGSTAAWWLAAIDDRVKAAVGIGCFTRYQDLLSTRGLGSHGIYYFVPGILQHFDTEAIMALIAPRPFLALTGDRDAGSPPTGIRELEQVLRQLYDLYGKPEHFQSIVFERTGHIYTPEMKERMISWFDRFL
jgi:dienelactone hydrolase